MSAELKERALFLSYFTVAYNLLEGAVSVVFGAAVGSVALIGFGIDSFVESFSGLVIIWRFKDHKTLTPEQEERIEHRAIRLVGYAFFVLAAYVLFESLRKLYTGEPPRASLVGIAVALISLAVMGFLYRAKRNTAHGLRSKSLHGDANQTLACMFLSVALLAGAGLHYFFGLWQADPAAGIIISGFLFREGYHAVKDEELCCTA